MGCGSSVPTPSAGSDSGSQANGAEKSAAKGAAAAPPAEANASRPAGATGSPSQSQTQQQQAAKSKTTRARRLSYVTTGQQEEAAQKPPGGSPSGDGNPSNKSASTRVRRLSYVTNDANMASKLQNPPEMGAEEGYDPNEPNEDDVVPEAPMESKSSDSKDRPLRVSVACMSRAGREPGFKKTNQDNCFAFEKYITADQSLFGAMDGHGPQGHLVSGYVKQHLPIILVNHLTTEKDIKKALSSGFMEVDRSLATSRIDCEFSGSTGVVSYLKGRLLTTAWVGDSRAVMGREGKRGLEAVELTFDHKPTNPDEKTRILKANGRVERLVDEVGQPMGPYRVWLQYAWIPGLAMSRALGDVLAHQVGVVSEPEFTQLELAPGDKFIVLASDGVWEFISNKEAVDIIGQYESAEEACRQLVDEAYQRWLTEEEGVVDDITAVVVKLHFD